MRAACPDVPVGVTSGAWAAAGTPDQLATLRTWAILPGFVSVNWHEDGADEVAGLLLERGIAIEAGIWNDEGLRAWSDSPWRGDRLRILIEIPGLEDPEEISMLADRLIESVGQCESTPILFHGEERSTWPALDLAAERSLDARIGLEDTLLLPDGKTAAGSRELVLTDRDRLGRRI